MAIYSRLGDCGETDLFPWGRIPKTHPLMEALGTLDELNAALGVVRAQGLALEEDAFLEGCQKTIFRICSQLSCQNPEAAPWLQSITAEDVTRLEAAIDRLDAQLPPLARMLCFQGPPAAAFTQLARAVCRRAERGIWKLNAFVLGEREERNSETGAVAQEICCWLNRFSDFLFTLGRFLALK